MKRLLLIAAASILFAAPASANIMFTLSNVQLQHGGELTGTITVSDDLKDVLDVKIDAPAVDIGGGHFFSAYTYDFANSVIDDSHLPTGYIRLDSGSNQLQLAFDLLTTSGTVFTSNSYETQATGGNRLLTGSLVVARTTRAPEPASWTLALAGLALVGFGMNRRRARA